MALDADDMRDVDFDLLEYLREGRITPSYARDRMIDEGKREVTSTYLGQRLQRFEEHGHVVNLFDDGLYELVDDPLGDDDDLRGDGAGTIAPAADADQAIADVVQDWRPGNNLDRREQRRAAGRAALEFLRDREVAQAEEFKRELEPEHPVDNQSPDTWWTKTARVCLKRAAEAGLVRLDQDNNDWHWGDDRDQEDSDEE
jgi:signal recognition particle subunit SEC65